jgi:hypothetical protein
MNDPDQTTGFDHGGIHPQLGLPPISQKLAARNAEAPRPSHRPQAHGQPITGTDCYRLGYFPMTSPVNAAIYAFGGLMLFALAIGFFGAPV